MTDFDGLFDSPDDVEKDTDVVGGGGFLWDSGLYKCTAVECYYSEAKSGAAALNFTFVNAEGKEFKETIYLSTKDKKTFYVNKQTKKKHNLPGYSTCYNIIALTIGKKLEQALKESVPQTLKIWDWKKGENVDTDVEHVLADIVGKEVILGIKKVRENKNKKVGDKYVPTAEIREYNTISMVFHADKEMTVPELEAKSEEPETIHKWKEKWEGEVHDKTVEVDEAALEEAEAEAESQTESLFG